MSHLRTYQKKNFVAQFIVLLVAFVFIVFFLFTIGFKFVVNSSLFINQLFSKPDTQNSGKTSDSFYGSLRVNDIPVSTNSASIMVSGTVDNYESIGFYLNDEKVNEITVDTSGIFSEEITGLKKGSNQLYLVAISEKNKKEKQSEDFTINFQNEKPKLEISEPSDQSRTNKQETTVVGTVAPNNSVKINSSPAVVDSQGGFRTNIKLKDGENKIEVTVLDEYNNSETKIITVNYNKEE